MPARGRAATEPAHMIIDILEALGLADYTGYVVLLVAVLLVVHQVWSALRRRT